MCVIIDPLGKKHIHDSSDHFSRLNFVLFASFKSEKYRQTCENGDHYRSCLWVGLVDQKCNASLIYSANKD